MSNTQPEPSMEEILASIRRIISEDEEETRAPQSAPTAARPRPVQAAPVQLTEQPVTRPQAQQPVYQTEPQLVARPAPEPPVRAPVEPPRRPAPPVQTAPVQTHVPQPVLQQPVPQPAARPAPQPVVQQAAVQQVAKQVAMSQADAVNTIVSETTTAAASKAFQSLTQKVKVTQSAEGKTIEDIVTELLRPMVREWLDAHLAGIVEEKVEAEVKRLARQGG